MIIAICNKKGGSGKTTAAVLLAYAFGAAGQTVGVIDRDPEQSAREWLEDCPAPGVETARPGVKYDITIIDTPGSLADSGTLRSIREANRIIIVTSTSPVDIRRTRRAAMLLQERRPDVTPVLLFSRFEAHTEFGRTRDEFAKLIGLPALKNAIPERKSIQRAAVQGYAALPPAERRNLSNLAIEILRLKS